MMPNPQELARCADWARDVGLDPAGTAPRGDVFVLVEHPLPWPCDVGDDPLLAALRDVAMAAPSRRTVRVQAIVGDDLAASRRVLVFTATAPPFVGYSRVEGRATLQDLPELVASLVCVPPPPCSASLVAPCR
jgi:hypothetical protein